MGDKTIKQWDEAAARYSEAQADSPISLFNRHYIESALGRLDGKTALDAGCGDGAYTALLQSLGADARGCDGSQEMLALAAKQHPNIAFEQADLEAALPYESGSFDVVLCNLVLMDIAHIDVFAAESARVLNRGGSLLWSIVHPAFYLGEWELEPDGEKGAKRVFDYISPQTAKNPFWGATAHFHRPLGVYLNAFARAGLFLEKLDEPPIPGVARHERIPLFVFARYRKP